jgi:hypothetical protein
VQDAGVAVIGSQQAAAEAVAAVAEGGCAGTAEKDVREAAAVEAVASLRGNEAGGALILTGAASSQNQFTSELLLDGSCSALQLDPEHLQEGVVVSSSCTCWFVDLSRQEKVPLLWSHPAAVTGMLAVGQELQQCDQQQQQQVQRNEQQQQQQGVGGGLPLLQQQQQQQQVLQEGGVVLTTAQDGVLRVWSLGQGKVRLVMGAWGLKIC